MLSILVPVEFHTKRGSSAEIASFLKRRSERLAQHESKAHNYLTGSHALSDREFNLCLSQIVLGLRYSVQSSENKQRRSAFF
jgi:hypothetical protein